MKIKLGVVFGGASVEHEISIISALQALEYINKEKYEVIPIYIDKSRRWFTGKMLEDINNYKDIDKLIDTCECVSLNRVNNEFFLVNNKKRIFRKDIKLDIIFPIVHGQNVEDGTLGGYFETIGIPYVGSSVLGSAIGQDKVILKQILSDNGLPIVPYVWFYDYEYINNKEDCLKKIKKIGYPVIVKPASLGSSIGISYVKNSKEIGEAIEEAIMYDKKIVVEKVVSDLIEVNCSVLGDYKDVKVSVLEEVFSKNNILTYSDKYIGGGKYNEEENGVKGIVSTDRIIPAKIDESLVKKIQDCSISVFKVLNLSGVCRIDYLVNSKTNEFFVNEPNIIPGSLSYYLWDASGIKYNELLDLLIEIAISNYKKSIKKINSFDTNILNSFDYNGVKK